MEPNLNEMTPAQLDAFLRQQQQDLLAELVHQSPPVVRVVDRDPITWTDGEVELVQSYVRKVASAVVGLMKS